MKIGNKIIDKKRERQIRNALKIGIQLVFFVFSPAIFTAAFSGVKYISNSLGLRQVVELNLFVKVLIALAMYTIMFGRFFCGYACAFGSVNDFFRAMYKWICKKAKKKPLSLPKKLTAVLRYLKYVILAAIIVTSYLGEYGKTSGYSPWDVFSMLRAGNYALASYIPGCILLGLLIIGMCIEDRFFCRFFCPMGAVFSILPILPIFTLRRKREECIKGCRGCGAVCAASIELPDHNSYGMRGECFMCNKCVGVCPKQHIQTKVGRLKGNEIWFVLLRATILLAGFYFLVNG